ncbi:hypothetical protein [Brevibacillus parabrevis]|uniref:hypothetical protein n=1 Tax=Brevibacillus parabrevis TaxID=54914 RepID=UPI0028D591D6|nr:hypothetical protein [Brevibacillus parabrevis]
MKRKEEVLDKYAGDHIFIVSGKDSRQFESNPMWKQLKAVKEGKVYWFVIGALLLLGPDHDDCPSRRNRGYVGGEVSEVMGCLPGEKKSCVRKPKQGIMLGLLTI